MRVVTNYSGADGKVRLMCVGHVLLEEHTGHGVEIVVPAAQNQDLLIRVGVGHLGHVGQDLFYPVVAGADLDGPFVVKPAESDTYWKHPFPTQKKAYVLQTRAEVDTVIDQIYEAGYSTDRDT